METLISVLEDKKNIWSEKVFLHIWNRNSSMRSYSYTDIYEGAKKYASLFSKRRIKKGDTIIIMLLTRVEFLYAFFGAMMIGAIPIPVHPPIFILEWDDYKEKLIHIYNVSKPKLILCYKDVERSVEEKVLKDIIDPKQILVLEDINLPEEAIDFTFENPLPEDIAYIQYTSGTTGLPKGAMLSHAALIKNIKAIGEKLELSTNDTTVSWMPLYHDMGLIGNCLSIMYWGCTLCLIPTEFFVMQPNTYFKIISDYKATVISSPNFGYAICNKYVNYKKITDVKLDSLRISLVGADHIEFNDLEEFNDKFSGYGLDRNIFLPVYGLGESCLGVAFSKPNCSVIEDNISWDILSREGRAQRIPFKKKEALRVISVGTPIGEQQVGIFNDKGEPLPDSVLGEICIKSDMLFQKYHNLPSETEKAFRNGWFLTGDIGYKIDGVFYFFERKPNILKRRGKVHRPRDFEFYCWQVKDIKRGRSALISLDGKEEDDTKLCLLIETGTFYQDKYIEIIEELNDIYKDEFGEIPDILQVVARGSIPQTSSGKTQRYKCKNKVIDKSFDTNFIYNNISKEVIYCK